MFGTFDISGNGGRGPSSTIFCLPTLPQRGIWVGYVGDGIILGDTASPERAMPCSHDRDFHGKAAKYPLMHDLKAAPGGKNVDS
jgi:hypothetical protein